MAYTARQLSREVANNPALAAKVKENPAEAIANAATPPPLSEAIYKIVVVTLGLALLISLGAAIYLKGQVSDFIVAVGSGALGALAGILAPAPTQPD